MQLTGLSFAYPDVPAHERAGMMEPRLSGEFGEVFVLSTCLRIEVAWSGGPDLAPSVLEMLYGSRRLPMAKMRTDLDAFHHLSRVAAGLESAQIGEAEVLSQFRQALESLFAIASGDSTLAHLIEAALGVGRSARRSLTGVQTGSLARAAAHIAGDLPGVVVLGGGAMARAVLSELDPSNVTIYGRRAAPVAGHPIRAWRELPAALTSCRAVVSTVPGPVPVIGETDRPDSRLLVVDLGMPPAITGSEPGDQLNYHGVDDIATSIEPISEPDAEENVALESEKTWGRFSVSDQAGSIIRSVVDRADQTVDEEVRRFTDRLSSADDADQILRQLAHRVARRMLHPSVSWLGSTPLSPQELDIVAKAFGVDRE